IKTGDHTTVELRMDMFHDEGAGPAGGAGGAVTSSTAGWPWQKWTGFGLAVGGVAALGVGTIFFINWESERSRIISDQSDLKNSCPANGCPPDKQSRAQTNQNDFQNNNSHFRTHH